MEASSSQGFRDPTRLTRALQFVLVALIVVGLMASVSSLFQYKFFQDAQAGAYQTQDALAAAANTSDFWQSVLSRIHGPLVIIRSVVLFIWVYRANFNARQLGAHDMEISPGWSVGWFFIPIANLWMPFVVMAEIWKASAAPLHWREARASGVVLLWWCLWLCVNLMSIALLATRPNAGDGIDAFKTFVVTVVVFYFFAVVLDFVCLAMVNTIYRMQMRHGVVQVDETFA